MSLYLAIATVLRLAGIWRAPLWYDENFTLILSRLPFSQMIAATAGDVHPPLWYLITWLIGRLDPPAWAIRLPAALFSIASVYLFWLILQHFALSPRVRTLAMWLMVLSPFEIYYAQEGRMYALLGFLVLLSVWSILERRWGVLFVAAVAMLYTQVYALFYLPSIALAGMILDRRDWLPINRSLALAGIMYLPWVAILQTQLTNIHQSYWIASLNIGGILSVLFGLFTGQGLPMAMQIPAMLVIFGWLVYALVVAYLKPSRPLITISVLAFMPLILASIASVIVQPVIIHRPLIGILPFMFILLAWPVDRLIADRNTLLYASVFILPVLITPLIGVYSRQVKNSVMPDGLTQIRAQWQPGDIIYHVGDGSWIDWAPYSPDLIQYKYPDCGAVLGGLSKATRQAMGYNVQPLDQLNYTRAWVVYLESPLNPGCELDAFVDIISGPPLIPLDNNKLIYSGVWLLENK
jgi:mannosyltransferase